MIPLILVWLRAAGLVGQSVALGGAALALFVLRPGLAGAPDRALHRTLALTGAGAAIAALAQAATLLALAAALDDGSGWPIADVLASTTGLGGLIRIGIAMAGVAAARALHASPASAARRAVLFGVALLLCFAGALASHAAGRIDSPAWLAPASALHQASAGIWVGGLICATAIAIGSNAAAAGRWLRPFSALAATAVTALALTGVALALEYVATPGAAIGTSYGAMVLTKIALFAALLALGALNHRALHGGFAWRGAGPASATGGGSTALWRRIEVEAGLAAVALFLAASIGSAPPAADVGAHQRVTPDEIRTVFTPRWPRLEAPSLTELAAASALGDPSAPHTAEDTAWSEFGHHVSGLFILAMGTLAILARTGRVPWARHWPLLFVGLTAFVAWNMDPEGWQTGKVGFWEHLLGLEVLQHRILLALTALLGLAEWRVHASGRPPSRWSYVFPFVCIVAGALLVSHAHEVGDAKSAILMELTHLPLALVILAAGWARWLELRLPGPEGAWPGRLWAPALALFGLLLLFYREG